VHLLPNCHDQAAHCHPHCRDQCANWHNYYPDNHNYRSNCRDCGPADQVSNSPNLCAYSRADMWTNASVFPSMLVWLRIAMWTRNTLF
jgi:hypothetical protein